ncbi:MAG TPA: hypothetical protein ENH82_02720 [bacterium]|nr:hypothetical protein [bacterium]
MNTSDRGALNVVMTLTSYAAVLVVGLLLGAWLDKPATDSTECKIFTIYNFEGLGSIHGKIEWNDDAEYIYLRVNNDGTESEYYRRLAKAPLQYENNTTECEDVAVEDYGADIGSREFQPNYIPNKEMTITVEDDRSPMIKIIFKPNLIITEDIGIPNELINKALNDSAYCDWIAGTEISGFTFDGVGLNFDRSNCDIWDMQLQEQILHTDTSSPVCPYCGEKEFTKYYRHATVKEMIHSGSSQNGDHYSWITEEPPDFYRCNSCNKDFTMTVREENNTFYTTERIE